MYPKAKLTFLCAAVLILTACNTAPARSVSVGKKADLAAISAFNAKYLKAINEGDLKALSALTDDDHIMIGPNGTPTVGKAANDAANERGFSQFNIDEQWMPEETVVDGDLAYQRGTFIVIAAPKTGAATRTAHGNFLRIYRRQADGSWRMTRDMFNSDAPVAPQE